MLNYGCQRSTLSKYHKLKCWNYMNRKKQKIWKQESKKGIGYLRPMLHNWNMVTFIYISNVIPYVYIDINLIILCFIYLIDYMVAYQVKYWSLQMCGSVFPNIFTQYIFFKLLDDYRLGKWPYCPRHSISTQIFVIRVLLTQTYYVNKQSRLIFSLAITMTNTLNHCLFKFFPSTILLIFLLIVQTHLTNIFSY